MMDHDPSPTDNGQSPYDPPKALDPAPASPPVVAGDKPKRPGAPFGIGLTLIICGSLAALFGIFGGLFTMTASAMVSSMAMLGNMAGDPTAQQTLDAIIESSGSIYVVQGALQVVMGIISVLALVAGIGLVKYRAWGLKAARVWAGLALIYILVSLVVNFIYVMPASEKMMETIMGLNPAGGVNPLSGMTSSISTFSQIFGSMLLAVLPVLALVLLSKDKVKACLS